MKRSLIYSITVLAATGLIASCTNKTETTTTTAPEKSPAKTDYNKKHKPPNKYASPTPKPKYEPTPKPNKYASPTPKPNKYESPTPKPKYESTPKASPTPTPTPY
jgi:protein TonB